MPTTPQRRREPGSGTVGEGSAPMLFKINPVPGLPSLIATVMLVIELKLTPGKFADVRATKKFCRLAEMPTLVSKVTPLRVTLTGTVAEVELTDANKKLRSASPDRSRFIPVYARVTDAFVAPLELMRRLLAPMETPPAKGRFTEETSVVVVRVPPKTDEVSTENGPPS